MAETRGLPPDTAKKLTGQIAGMIGRWYPQAAAADGGALLAECIVSGPVPAVVADLIADAERRGAAEALTRVLAVPDPWDHDLLRKLRAAALRTGDET